MDNLIVAVIQTSLFWEDKNANLAMLEEKIRGIDSEMDLILLPEMFNSGFSMHPQKIAEPVNGQTTKWMMYMAKIRNAAIAGSIAIQIKDVFYNRFLFVTPDGIVQFYDKINTFSFAGENIKYESGKNIKIIYYKEWRICLQICYDLRFPETARNKIINPENEDYLYDLLLYCANWPTSRILSWNCLLQARAIENVCFVVGTNRTGTDKNEIEYNGNSAITFFDPTINFRMDSKEQYVVFQLNWQLLDINRMKYPFLKDQKF